MNTPTPTHSHQPELSGFLYSQIGYDTDWPKKAMVRSTRKDFFSGRPRFEILHENQVILSGDLTFWGEKWGSFWWIADFSALQQNGTFLLLVRDGADERLKSDPIEIGSHLLWEKSWKLVALEQNERRARLAMNGVGWQDCGAAWQEANSHAALVIGFTDMLEFTPERLAGEDRKRLEAQIITGCDYLALLQDWAPQMGHAPGALSHQKPKYQEMALISDVTKAAVTWARSSRFLSDAHAEKKKDYQNRAHKAFEWAAQTTPLTVGFSPINHGAPRDYLAPAEWMTRDLFMMVWAALEIAELGDSAYLPYAVEWAEKGMRRQISKSEAEGGYYGHFRTFEKSPFTEKAWIHSVDRGQIGIDAGGHYPHYIIPLLQLLKLQPDHPHAAQWKQCVHDFAYGYFLPACRQNPFHLLPLGYFSGIGLLWFSGLWHGMNAAYALAAVLAREFELHFSDPQFREIAVGNVQWIAGVNAGITAEGIKVAHMYSEDLPAGEAFPVSMIHGLGGHFAGSYMNIRGSICNGFSTGEQFQYDIEPSLESDGPHTFTDEDWVTHSGAWLSALVRLFPDFKRPV
jgi:hypothetical protein